MRLASLQLRLARRDSLVPSLAFPRSLCRLDGDRFATASVPSCPAAYELENHNAHIPPSRFYSTVVSPVLPERSQDDDGNESSPQGSPATTEDRVAPPKPYLSHLKRRGHFLPAAITNKPALTPAGASSHLRGVQQRQDKLMLSAEHYGKWRELIFDYDQLMFESGLIPGSLSKRKTQRSVDRPEHATDISLWSAILNFAQRRGDSAGVMVVWQEIFQRKQLYQVDSAMARMFWQSVVEAALEDDSLLESTWAYAEWMYDTHGVLWPNYYRTVVVHYLEAGDYSLALHWHMRLSTHFAIPRRDFFDMLKGFITDPDPELQQTLQQIYATSHHRNLYDTIVPMLWSRGHSALARAWRETLILHDDLPSSSASRPFLQYLAGYYPESGLCAQEETIASSLPEQYETPPEQREPKTDSSSTNLPSNIFHFMNRVHGETFGIKEKSFDDKIGSKWFATSWVSLDTAVNLVYSLGIVEIGPLSLQSIALREGTPAGIVRRLEQLEQYQISIGRANYSKAIRHLAKIGDAETLYDLLHSTLHPDVFDDIVLQRQVLGSATFRGDWKLHRLVLAVRLAVSEDALVTSSNLLLLSCLSRNKKATALKLLDELSARGIELLPSTSGRISRLILADAPHRFKTNDPPDVDFYSALCRRLAAMRLPVATEVWQNILLILGKQGRLADLERVALDIVRQYTLLQKPSLAKPSEASASLPSSSLSDETSAFKVHIADVPTIVRGGEHRLDKDVGYRLLPRDLPLSHPLHPVSLIFNDSLVESIVRWYFHRMGAYRHGKGARLNRRQRHAEDQGAAYEQGSISASGSTAAASPKSASDFSLAGGIRLLAMLRDRGVDIPTAKVRSETLLCIMAVFGPNSTVSRVWQPVRSANQLKVGEMKELCDAAWGRPEGLPPEDASAGETETLLPQLSVLENALEAVKPMATTFSNKITPPMNMKKKSRDSFMDAIKQQS